MSPNELSELVPLAATLNEESNQLNQTIASLNERIAALNLGITVWTGTRKDDDTDQEYQIGFAKLASDGNGWQLAVRERTFSGSGFSGSYPLLQASRNLRIDGLESVPGILVCLKSAALDKIRAMQNGKQMVSELEGPIAFRSNSKPKDSAPRHNQADAADYRIEPDGLVVQYLSERSRLRTSPPGRMKVGARLAFKTQHDTREFVVAGECEGCVFEGKHFLTD